MFIQVLFQNLYLELSILTIWQLHEVDTVIYIRLNSGPKYT